MRTYLRIGIGSRAGTGPGAVISVIPGDLSIAIAMGAALGCGLAAAAALPIGKL